MEQFGVCIGLRLCRSQGAAVQHSLSSSVSVAKRCCVSTRHRSGRAFRPRAPIAGITSIGSHCQEVSVLHRACIGFIAAATRCHALSVAANLGGMCAGFRHFGSTQATASANKLFKSRRAKTHAREQWR